MQTNKHKNKPNNADKKNPVLFRKIISGISSAQSNKIYTMSGQVLQEGNTAGTIVLSGKITPGNYCVLLRNQTQKSIVLRFMLVE